MDVAPTIWIFPDDVDTSHNRHAYNVSSSREIEGLRFRTVVVSLRATCAPSWPDCLAVVQSSRLRSPWATYIRVEDDGA